MNIRKAILSLFLLTISFSLSSCNISSEFQNGTYYMDGNSDIYFTVTDLKDDVDPEGKYYKTCKIQFSEAYDIEAMQESYIYVWSMPYALEYFGDGEKVDKAFEEYQNLFQQSVDMKKQLVDNACTFYIYDIVDEEYDSIYAHIDGADEDSYMELQLDSDGSVAVPIPCAALGFIDYVTFKK